MQIYDVIVVGGSYAGMAAALQVARARRKVMVIDAGFRRNRFAAHSHGFLTQDGADPAEIAALGRRQVEAYANVVWTESKAERAARDSDRFTIAMQDGTEHGARRLILALGVTDTLPDIPGLQERWGKSVFHCPYCHGYERNDDPLGVLAIGAVSQHQAMLLPDWGPTTLFLNGTFLPDQEQRQALARRKVTIEPARVIRVSGEADVELEDGRVIALAGIFTAPHTRPSTSLAENLGCGLQDGPLGPYLRVSPTMETSVPGVFACGDAARPVGTVSSAVGDGALAGAMAHQSLIFR